MTDQPRNRNETTHEAPKATKRHYVANAPTLLESMSMVYKVSRQTWGGNPDVLIVFGEHGQLCVFQPMQPPHDLSPRTADEARARPWFYTGSPHGAHIIGLAWERHALANTKDDGA